MEQTIDTIKAALAAFDEAHYDAVWAPVPNREQITRNQSDMDNYRSSIGKKIRDRAYGENDDIWDCVDAHKTFAAVGKYL